MSDQTTEQTDTPKQSKAKTPFEQSKAQSLSPNDKHKNYLDDLERLHNESVVDSLGHTPRAG